MQTELKAMRALLTPPQNWTKGQVARTSTNIPVSAKSHEATCWCLMGAIVKVANPEIDFQIEQALSEQLPMQFHSLVQFNDDRNTTHEQVLSLIDRTISPT